MLESTLLKSNKRKVNRHERTPAMDCLGMDGGDDGGQCISSVAFQLFGSRTVWIPPAVPATWKTDFHRYSAPDGGVDLD